MSIPLADIHTTDAPHSKDSQPAPPSPTVPSVASCTLAPSTDDLLISPRPLGPTHLLVAHDTETLSGYFPRIIECPINDLAFAANCPNMHRSGAHARLLPHRSQHELPRVLLRVPTLAALPEFVAYLHTKNQAALFRACVAEWIRDAVHPIPRQAAAPAAAAVPIAKAARIRYFFGFRRRRRACSYLQTGGGGQAAATGRSVDSIAREIAEAEASVPHAAGPGDVATAMANLEALRQHAVHLGYYSAELWFELQFMLDVLRKAVSARARLDKAEA
jgi:hypothetical protein